MRMQVYVKSCFLRLHGFTPQNEYCSIAAKQHFYTHIKTGPERWPVSETWCASLRSRFSDPQHGCKCWECGSQPLIPALQSEGGIPGASWLLRLVILVSTVLNWGPASVNKGASKQRRSDVSLYVHLHPHPGSSESRQCSKPLRHLSSPWFIFLKKDSSTIYNLLMRCSEWPWASQFSELYTRLLYSHHSQLTY